MLFLIKLRFSWKKKWFFNYFFDSEKSKWSRTSQFFRCNYLGPGRGSPTRTISASNMAVWINQSGWRPTLRKLTHSSVPLSVQRRTPLAKSAFKGLTRNILLITSLMENVLIPRGKIWRISYPVDCWPVIFVMRKCQRMKPSSTWTRNISRSAVRPASLATKTG